MNISLSQKEITAAVRAYVASRGIGAGFVLSDVKFSMTRNPAAISAELTLEDQSESLDVSPAKEVVQSPTSVGGLIGIAENTIQTSAETLVAAANSTTPIEEVKSVPEETTAAVDAGATPEPTPEADPAPAADTATAAVNTTSLFG